jgi:uncharacterized membrane protein (DUF4010 family)
MTDSIWFNFAVALGLGLLIGLERERSKGEGPTRRAAGIRTFALFSLVGALAVHIGAVVLLATVTAVMATLVAMSYLFSHDDDPGLTTEVGLIITTLLGGLAISDVELAAGLGVAVAALFAAKAPVHNFVRSTLTDAELHDSLILAIATLIVWPQLPDRNLGPFDALNPHLLWLLVILVLFIGIAGHVATRLLGTRYGLPIAGFASGFISSTATIGSMAGYAADHPTNMASAVAGAALSTVATFVQMALLLFVVSQPVLVALTPALAAGGLAAAIYGLMFIMPALGAADTPRRTEPGRVFNIQSALILAATMAAMLVAAALLKDRYGAAGVVAGAALAGFVDAHSAAISVASLATAEKLSPDGAVLPILVAMSSNAVAKGVMAVGAGARGFALRIIPGLVLSMAATWIVGLATTLR